MAKEGPFDLNKLCWSLSGLVWGHRVLAGFEIQTMKFSASSAGMVFFFSFLSLESGERVRIGVGSRPHQTVFFHPSERENP